jgi:hypothetical protein
VRSRATRHRFVDRAGEIRFWLLSPPTLHPACRLRAASRPATILVAAPDGVLSPVTHGFRVTAEQNSLVICAPGLWSRIWSRARELADSFVALYGLQRPPSLAYDIDRRRALTYNSVWGPSARIHSPSSSVGSNTKAAGGVPKGPLGHERPQCETRDLLTPLRCAAPDVPVHRVQP